MKIRKGEPYYLHWTNNPSTWNESLNELKRRKAVKKIGSRYYTEVYPHYSGITSVMYVVDCTCDKQGNFHAIHTDLLKEFDI